VIAFAGIAYLCLRASALRGRRRVLAEIDAHGMSGLFKLTDLPAEEVRRRLATMQFWPMRRPTLAQTIGWYALISTGLVFYKLGIVYVVATLVVTSAMRGSEED
jgi:hypothetical protein